MKGTKYAEFYRDFLEMETDLDLYSFSIDGMYVWERIRYLVALDILVGTGVWHSRDPIEYEVSDYLTGGYLWARNLFIRNPFFASDHDVLYNGHPRRKRLEDGCWWDIYCDPIHEATEFDYLHIEVPYWNHHYTPAKTGNLRYLDLIHSAGSIGNRLNVPRRIPTDEQRRWFRTLEQEVKGRFGIEPDIEQMVWQKVRRRAITLRPYERLIGQVDPELVVLIGSSGKETFIEACKQLDVPVVELQHGHIAEESLEYSFPGNRTKRTFPDYLLTFGEFWAGSNTYPIDEENVIPVGYPHLERQRRRYADVKRTDKVLFTSQWPITSELAQLAIKLAEYPDREYEIVFKLHPDEYVNWQKDHPGLVTADLEVVDNNERSLHRMMAESRAQVGVYSTTLFEGLAFGLDTYLAQLPGVEMMEPVVARGDATLVDSAANLHRALQSGTSDTISITDYFEPNALANIESTISSLLGR